MSEAKNLHTQFEKKNEILRRGGNPPLPRMTILGDFSEFSDYYFSTILLTRR